MGPSPLENYLVALSQELERLVPDFVESTEASLSLDELVQQDFERLATVELGELAALMDQLAQVRDHLDGIASLNWFRRHLRRAERQNLQQSQRTLEEALHIARSKMFLAERKHRTDPKIFARILQQFETLGAQRERIHQFESLRRSTAEILHQILQAQLIYGRENVVLSLPAAAPVFHGSESIGRVLSFLDQLQHTLPEALKREAIDLAGVHDAEQIRNGLNSLLRTPESVPLNSTGASTQALANLLVRTAQVKEVVCYEDLEKLAARPTMFRQLESWLIFWTCKAWGRSADSGSALETASLCAKVDKWCDAWREQSSRWSPGTLQRFAAGFEALPCAHFRLGSQCVGKASHDVLFLLTVAAPGRIYCRIAGVHFCSAEAQLRSDASIAEQGRVVSTVANLHSRSRGRWHGLVAAWPHNLWAPLLSVDYRNSFITSPARLEHGCEDPIELSIALTECLTTTQGNAFETIGDAFYWLGEVAGLPLPRNLIVMSIGHGAEVMRDVPGLVQHFGRTFGGTYSQVLCQPSNVSETADQSNAPALQNVSH